VKELNLKCDTLPTERALGVSWFVETDAFGFRVNIKEKPSNRRGILSVAGSVYDPLGMAGLLFSQQGFSFRTYAEKASVGVMRFRVYNYLVGKRGLLICRSFLSSQSTDELRGPIWEK